LGVIAIITVAGVFQMAGMVVRSVLGLPPREGREREKGRGRTVIGVSLPGAESGEHAALVEDLQRRMAELEERLDFAERMLAQQKDVAQLNPPKR
jgi:hypothetical protein